MQPYISLYLAKRFKYFTDNIGFYQCEPSHELEELTEKMFQYSITFLAGGMKHSFQLILFS